jgi:DNA helicase-2/ATP-dependent DNA helicase PcrA
METLRHLMDPATPWPGVYELARNWYEPRLPDIYEAGPARSADLEQLGTIAATFENRGSFLAELALDPPRATCDEAGAPHLDEDFLILSTIHSAKGQEWTNVYVLRVSDGCIPSDMACGNPEEIEEERRLLYVAMTRARDELHLVHPQRFYTHQQARNGDRHVYAPRSRFLPDEILRHFEIRALGHTMGTASLREAGQSVCVDIGNQMVNMWR